MIYHATLNTLLSLMVLLLHSFALAGSPPLPEQEQLTADIIYRGFDRPWALEFIDTETTVVTEKRGKLWLFNLEDKSKTEVSGVPAVRDHGQGGLLDVALDPEHASNKALYLCYTHQGKKGSTTRLAKATLEKNHLQKLQVLFTAEPYFTTGRHYGCRIAFDQEGLLYLSVGDRGKRDLAQSLESHNGKIIRLRRDGTVPNDNPFIGKQKAQPEIYSFGHRNPQGLVYDGLRKRLIAVEHGPQGGDEINIVHAGKNYGWPILTYGKEYSGGKVGAGITHQAGMEQPLYHYTPSIAPGGADIYTGDAIPDAKGDLFVAALKLQHLNHISFDKTGGKPSEQRLFGELNQRIRDVKQSPDKKLYFITDQGWLAQVKYTGTP
ncbi:Glucose/arabinose dehydrogenase, beta-propeller fold [Alteromonadaceae bacterium Bs31]|nr:Glucose/arabinose dehydrogenase, beta-propeller fold [Alteromonadaceae bacterium Bs31]SMF58569.1 Glucose/arabinose dehydrogenase, beta-propeller fold [Alteromonadaceae bacterium Bs31]